MGNGVLYFYPFEVKNISEHFMDAVYYCHVARCTLARDSSANL